MGEVQLWVSTLEIGAFYAIIGLAYLVVYQGTSFFNFAIGPFAMAAALGASWLVIEHDFPTWPAVLIGIVGVVLLSGVTELVVVRPIANRTNRELTAVIAVAALLFAVMQGAGLLFGRSSLPGLQLLDIDPIEVGDGIVQPATLLLILTTIVAFVALALWTKFSPSGRLLRAVGSNKDAATILGLPVSRVRLTAFLISGLLAAVGGILYAPKAGVGFDRGLTWTLAGFLALVVGGTGSIWAPLVGGLVIGMLQVFVPYYLGSAAPDYAMLLVALLFFAFRPEGIFMRRVRA